MGWNPFASTPLLSNITINEDNKYFKMVDGVLFDINETRIVSYLQTKQDEHYDIPETVVSIDNDGISRNTYLQLTSKGRDLNKKVGNE